MIRLSKMADYGVVLLTYVAGGPTGQVLTARDLAKMSGLPLPTVSKVVKTLAKSGLLLGHRGVHGGYSLAKDATQISVADVIGAMEGPVAMTSCTQNHRAKCVLLATCPTRSAWAQLNRRVLDTLTAMSLADMRLPAALAISPRPSVRAPDGAPQPRSAP